MSKRLFSKMSNQMYIDGYIRGNFLRLSSKFDMVISFTPLKQIIIDISIEGVDLSDSKLGINFKIGDSILIAQKWAELKGFKYNIIKRFN